MGKVTIVKPVFDEVVDLKGEMCAACGLPLMQTTHPDQQVGTVGTDLTGLPTIAIYHLEHAPTFLRAAVRVNECKELEAMLDEDADPRVEEESEPEVRYCAAQTWAGNRYGPAPEPPEYCEEEAEPDSDYCVGHNLEDEF